MRRALQTVGERLREEGGIALIMALGTLLVLTMGFATSIALTASDSSHAQSSNADQKAYALAEDGINEAVAVVFADGNKPPTSLTCSSVTWTGGGPGYARYDLLLTPARTT